MLSRTLSLSILTCLLASNYAVSMESKQKTTSKQRNLTVLDFLNLNKTISGKEHGFLNRAIKKTKQKIYGSVALEVENWKKENNNRELTKDNAFKIVTKVQEELEAQYATKKLVNNSEQERLLNEEWLKTHTKQCPKCQVHIEKMYGSDHMRCIRCRHEFCWSCLANFYGYQHGDYGYRGFNCPNQDKRFQQ